MAAETFKQLTTYSNNFTEYATFFYALSSYYSGKTEIAKNILLQLTRKFPNWVNNHEAYYWLGKIYFEKGDYALALEQLSRIKKGDISTDVSNLKLFHLSNASVDELQNLYQQYQQDAEVGESLARAIGQQPLNSEQLDQLQQLVDRFNLPSEEITNQFVGQTVKKDRYKVAVCFPFLTNELNQDPRLNTNQWVLDLYQGIQLANESLNDNNVKIDLYAYDTERDSAKMAKILSLDEIKSMDLLIGPLYPGPSKLAYAFAFDEKVNILNPLSSNTEIISSNPYSFLFNPADDTQARVAGEFMKDHIDPEKKSLIIYGSRPGDSIAAFQYAETLIDQGIDVIMMDQIPTVDSEQVAKFVSDHLYQIFTPLSDDPVLLAEKTGVDEERQEQAFIPRSDLGHVFIASTNELIVANVIGTLDNIGAEITVMSNDRWLQSRYADFQQLERLKVYMLAPGFLDYQSDNFKNFQRKYRRRFGSIPNNYSFIGYDLMLFFGKQLYEGGTYFQNDLRENEFYPGYLFQGFSYMESNDNAHVPIIRFENGVLKQVN
ncbi:MAG: hypothetical protein DHS20C17_28630 [Cyclobacteriaceae bacterium]|nr:MAG: hypothetical protein DHS20C17_28630 [Cyclobacteriaceae bacterium]